MKRNTEVLMAIQAVSKQFRRRIRQIGDRYGLTQIEANILSFLTNNPGRDTASDIIELRGFSKAIVSQGIESLVRKELVTRREDPSDRRITHLSLTGKSAPITAALQKERQLFQEQCFCGFSNQEKQSYLELTDRIVSNLITGD